MKLPNSSALWVIWGASRAAFFAIWLIFVPNSQRDVTYYFDKLRLLGEVGPGATLIEYPTPVIWLLQVPMLTSFGTALGYTISFVGWLLLLDFGIAFALWRRGDDGSRMGMLVWTVVLLCMGATVYLRFDLITAALAGAALLLVANHKDRLGGGLVALGAAIKLWPALLWPALLGHGRRENWRTTAAFWGFGIALALASWWYGGWQRLFTPLTWQAERGLQIESVWATVPMVQRAVEPTGYVVELSPWQAFEIFGPGVSGWLRAASVATVIGLASLVLAYVGWLRRPHRTGYQAALLMCFVILVMIATGKTFSPQYLMWLAGPLAAAWALLGAAPPETKRQLSRLSVSVIGLTVLTQLIYPIGYGQLVEVSWGTTLLSGVLALRNLALVCLTIWLGAQIYRFTWKKA